MIGKLKYVLALLLAVPMGLYAQLSPGELTSSHAHLEGMSNCTQCHVLGEKVTDQKCLDCHTEINSLIRQNRGYHSSSEVRGKECIDCHSEHHGRKFDMVRFDEDKFDHGKTGYRLEGQHDVIDCRKCHAPENISDTDLRKRSGTFLGLEKECLSCHDDFHQGTLSKDCLSCHDMKAFRPASKFDHGEADFQLRGKHMEVDCKECHAVSTKSGKEFQEFTDVAHNDCASCHADPHSGHFNVSCAQCHTEESFTSFNGTRNFDHSRTAFALKGAHKSINCFECHTRTSDPVAVFQDRLGAVTNECATCHDDVHEGKFGNDCAQCHQESSFLMLKSMDFFDHDVTDFPLVGQHIEVDCKQCHEERFTTAIDFSACKNCHDDYHEGEFADNGVSPDCDQCHSVERKFDFTSFGFEQHEQTEFPLQGAHLATPCFACHISEDRWSFRDVGSNCFDCHENVHGSEFEVNGTTDCARCHVTDNWIPSKFDHSTTKFPLEGRHAEVECTACHKSEERNGEIVVVYKIESFECIDCHK